MLPTTRLFLLAPVLLGGCQVLGISHEKSFSGPELVLDGDTPMATAVVTACGPGQPDPHQGSLVTFEKLAVAVEADDDVGPGATVRIGHEALLTPEPRELQVGPGDREKTVVGSDDLIGDTCDPGLTLTVERIDPELAGRVTVTWAVRVGWVGDNGPVVEFGEP